MCHDKLVDGPECQQQHDGYENVAHVGLCIGLDVQIAEVSVFLCYLHAHLSTFASR